MPGFLNSRSDDDPFPVVKRELDEQMQQLAALGAQLSAFPGADAGAFHAAAGHVAEQLGALEAAVAAMVLQPSKFGLTLQQAMQRQVEAETLRFQLADLQATCGLQDVPMRSSAAAPTGPGGRPSSSSSGRLHKAQPPRPPPEGALAFPPAQLCTPAAAAVQGAPAPHAVADDDTRRVDTGYADDALLQQQQQQQWLRRQQDADLDHISLQVESVRHTGDAMHEELEEQAALLGGLQAGADSTQQRLHGAARKVAELLRRMRHDRQLCLILALAGLLVVLTLIALA